MLNFLHLSDTHYMADYKGKLEYLGLDYDPRLVQRDFLKNFDYSDIDFVTITGDLVYDGGLDDYKALKEMLDELIPVPYYLVLGNHDPKEAFYQAFDIQSEKEYYYMVEVNGYRLIFLDSAEEDTHGGVFSKSQQDWLEEVLKEDSLKGTLLFYHHPVDDIGLGEVTQFEKSYDSFYQAVQNSDVIGMFAGHLHSNLVTTFGRVPQFVANSMIMGAFVDDGVMYFTDELAYSRVSIDRGRIMYKHCPLKPKGKITKSIEWK